MIGSCKPIDECAGAALAGNCTTSGLTCCIEEISPPLYKPENRIITKEIFLKISGNTLRNQAIYNYFVESMELAEIKNEYQAASYLSQLIGETKYFKSMESLQIESDFTPQLGNNATGDGIKFRGRGSILLRGKRNYELANARIGMQIVKVFLNLN